MIPALVKFVRENPDGQFPLATTPQSSPSSVSGMPGPKIAKTLPAAVQASVPKAKETEDSTTPTSVAAMMTLVDKPPTPTIRITHSNAPPKTAETSTAVVKTKTPTTAALKGKAKKGKQKSRISSSWRLIP